MNSAYATAATQLAQTFKQPGPLVGANSKLADVASSTSQTEVAVNIGIAVSAIGFVFAVLLVAAVLATQTKLQDITLLLSNK